MNPPLASRADRDALIEGLADGSVDAIATDHAPHHPASKDVEFDRAPFGITGFETALALGLERTRARRETFADAPGGAIYHRPGTRSGHRAKNRSRRAGRSDDFLDRSQVDVSRRRFAEQIAQHSFRRPHISRRTNGDDRRWTNCFSSLIRISRSDALACPNCGEDFSGVALCGDFLPDLADYSVRADPERHAHDSERRFSEESFHPPGAVGLNYVEFRIGEQRKIQVVLGLEFCLSLNGIAAATDDRGVRRA